MRACKRSGGKAAAATGGEGTQNAWRLPHSISRRLPHSISRRRIHHCPPAPLPCSPPAGLPARLLRALCSRPLLRSSRYGGHCSSCGALPLRRSAMAPADVLAAGTASSMEQLSTTRERSSSSSSLMWRVAGHCSVGAAGSVVRCVVRCVVRGGRSGSSCPKAAAVQRQQQQAAAAAAKAVCGLSCLVSAKAVWSQRKLSGLSCLVAASVVWLTPHRCCGRSRCPWSLARGRWSLARGRWSLPDDQLQHAHASCNHASCNHLPITFMRRSTCLLSTLLQCSPRLTVLPPPFVVPASSPSPSPSTSASLLLAPPRSSSLLLATPRYSLLLVSSSLRHRLRRATHPSFASLRAPPRSSALPLSPHRLVPLLPPLASLLFLPYLLSACSSSSGSLKSPPPPP